MPSAVEHRHSGLDPESHARHATQQDPEGVNVYRHLMVTKVLSF